jgi:hypothetical protein
MVTCYRCKQLITDRVALNGKQPPYHVKCIPPNQFHTMHKNWWVAPIQSDPRGQRRSLATASTLAALPIDTDGWSAQSKTPRPTSDMTPFQFTALALAYARDMNR